MSEIIERVARAICRAEGLDPDLPCSGLGILIPIGEVWPAWRVRIDRAHAALAAIREPTEAMIRAGLDTGQFENEATATSPNAPRHVWQAMIDEAGK